MSRIRPATAARAKKLGVVLEDHGDRFVAMWNNYVIAGPVAKDVLDQMKGLKDESQASSPSPPSS